LRSVLINNQSFDSTNRSDKGKLTFSFSIRRVSSGGRGGGGLNSVHTQF
jgi:hypothetical protein